MKKESLAALAVAAIGAVAFGAYFLWQQFTPTATPSAVSDKSEQARIPDFSLRDFNGNLVTTSDLEGRPLVVNVWAAWCPFCVKELPEFAEVQREFGESVVFIAVNRAEDEGEARSFIEKLGIANDMVYLLDPADSFYRSIGGFSMPETLFIDESGILKEHKRGPLTIDEVRERVQKLIQ